jgi:hypothetical protein
MGCPGKDRLGAGQDWPVDHLAVEHRGRTVSRRGDDPARPLDVRSGGSEPLVRHGDLAGVDAQLAGEAEADRVL